MHLQCASRAVVSTGADVAAARITPCCSCSRAASSSSSSCSCSFGGRTLCGSVNVSRANRANLRCVRSPLVATASVKVDKDVVQQDTNHTHLGGTGWPQKSSLYILRTDGASCSRELVSAKGRLKFAYPSTQQHLLVWRNRPKSVMVVKKLGLELTSEFVSVVKYLAEKEHMRVIVEPHMFEECKSLDIEMEHLFTFDKDDRERLSGFVDFVVCLGGDGVILHVSKIFKSTIPPVISFHLGSMGFLTNHAFTNHLTDLHHVIYGCQTLETCKVDSMDVSSDGNLLGVMVTLRMRLMCEIYRAGSKKPEQAYEVLNEVVVDRGSSSFLTNIECFVNQKFVTKVQADGIIMATPTGSTAYSLAAGGSMVHPNVPAILLTPVCPHSLNFRPVILPDYAEIEMRIPKEARCGAWVSFDGKERQEIRQGDVLKVKMSGNPVPTINETDLTVDWFDSLDRCFRWSNRVEQKPLPIMPGTNGTSE